MAFITTFFNNFKLYIIGTVIVAVLGYVGSLHLRLYFSEEENANKDTTIKGLQQGLADMQVLMEKRVADAAIDSHEKVHDEKVKQITNRNDIVVGNKRL